MAFMKERLKQRRLDMNLTLQEVANILGVEKPTVQRYESGVIKNVDNLTVEKLAKIMKCSPAYLMGWTDKINELPSSNIYSKKDHRLIMAYRNNPLMQGAVDKILSIDEAVANSDSEIANDFSEVFKIDNGIWLNTKQN